MAITANIARGIRNNNPLNIIHDPANKWLGLADPPSDGRFCRFISADYGIRAACLLLMKYQDRDGINTIRGIISKWAPATENNVNAYVAAVSTYTGLPADLPLDLHDRSTVKQLVHAMGNVENGTEIDTIPVNRGLALAGFAAPIEAKSILATPTMVAATAVAVPVAAVTIGSVVEALDDNAEIISGIVTSIGGPAAGGIAIGVLTGISWGWQFYNRLKVRSATGV